MLGHTTLNCSPIKPSFGNKVDRMNEVSDILRNTNGLKELDEDKMEQIKDFVEGFEVDPKSKVQGPLKSFALTAIALTTGTLLTRATANKVLAEVGKREVVQKAFKSIGQKLIESGKYVKDKAAEEGGKVKKTILGAVDTTMDFITQKATKGVKSKKGSNAYYEKAGKQITEKFVDTAASIVGFSTTAAGLAVDKDNNGKSDVLEVGNKKRLVFIRS